MSGHFGVFGGRFAPESLMAALEQLTKEYEAARTDPEFTGQLADLLTNYAARPTLVSGAKRFGAEYCGGSVGGPHPFPMMVRDFQRVIGVEARQQVLDLTGKLPDAVVACVGGGSNAIG